MQLPIDILILNRRTRTSLFQQRLSATGAQSEVCSLRKCRTTHLLGRGKFHHWEAHWQGDIKGGQCAHVEPNAASDFAFGCLRVEINTGLSVGIERGELYARVKDASLMCFELFRHTIRQAKANTFVFAHTLLMLHICLVIRD